MLHLPVPRRGSQCQFESMVLPMAGSSQAASVLIFLIAAPVFEQGYSCPGVSLSFKVSFLYLLALCSVIAGLYVLDKETGLLLKGHATLTRYIHNSPSVISF